MSEREPPELSPEEALDQAMFQVDRLNYWDKWIEDLPRKIEGNKEINWKERWDELDRQAIEDRNKE